MRQCRITTKKSVIDMEAFGIILLLAAMAFVLSAAHSLVSQWLDQDDKSQDRKK